MEKLLEVSLCMIVKNEEKTLSRCLNSIKDIVDEMIIVDTGSSDKTIEIAKSYGARVEHYNWDNNFSNARNYSLKFPTKEWILLMDADDEFDLKDTDKFINLVNKSTKDGHFFKTLSYAGSGTKNIIYNQNLRLIRNKKGYIFEGKIHEQIANKNGLVCYSNFSSEDIKIYHYGYLNDVIQEKNKRERNITIIKEELKYNPNNKFQKYNLAVELFSLGKFKEALELFNEVYSNLDFTLGYAPKTVFKRILCMYELKDMKSALKSIEEGLIIYPSFTDLEYFRGIIYNELKMYTLAIDSFNKCLLMGEPSINLAVIKGSSDVKSLEKLAVIYEYFRDYERAIKIYERCMIFEPNEYSYLCKISNLIKKNEDNEEIIVKRIESYFANDSFVKYKLLAYIFMEEEIFEVSYGYIKKCLDIKYDGQVYFLLGKYYMYTNKRENALKIFNELISSEEDNFDCVKYMVLINILADKYNEAMVQLAKFNTRNIKYKYIYEDIINMITYNKLPENISIQEIDQLIKIIKELYILNEEWMINKITTILDKIEDKNVHLNLASLYYSRKLNDKAFEEVIKSIKRFDEIDEKAIEIINMSKRIN